MNQLYLLRHGDAEKQDYRNGKDAGRKLTAAGKKVLRAEAEGMRRLGVCPALILASPLIRARQTAEIIAEGLGVGEPVEECLPLAPGHPPSEVLRALSRHKPLESVMLVGHEPNMGVLATTLLARSHSHHIEFKKGGLALIEVSSLPQPGKGVLRWLLTPEQLFLPSKR